MELFLQGEKELHGIVIPVYVIPDRIRRQAKIGRNILILPGCFPCLWWSESGALCRTVERWFVCSWQRTACRWPRRTKKDKMLKITTNFHWILAFHFKVEKEIEFPRIVNNKLKLTLQSLALDESEKFAHSDPISFVWGRSPVEVGLRDTSELNVDDDDIEAKGVNVASAVVCSAKFNCRGAHGCRIWWLKTVINWSVRI